jgi:hypothetical protein
MPATSQTETKTREETIIQNLGTTSNKATAKAEHEKGEHPVNKRDGTCELVRVAAVHCLLLSR